MDVHHIGPMQNAMANAEEGVPHRLKSFDACGREVHIGDAIKRGVGSLREVGFASIEHHLHIFHVGINVLAMLLHSALYAGEASRSYHCNFYHIRV